jgi:hypothetical protein
LLQNTIEFYQKSGTLLTNIVRFAHLQLTDSVFIGGNMTLLTLVIFTGLAYGVIRFTYTLAKEIKEFCIEAWRDVEI